MFYVADMKRKANMSVDDILREAKLAPLRDSLSDHREAIEVLRKKNYTWRQIAQFLADRGVDTDHTKIFRFIKKRGDSSMENSTAFEVPTADQYKGALMAIEPEITTRQREMLKRHFNAHNRTATYTELAQAAGYETNDPANRFYGDLGKRLRDQLGMPLNEENDLYSNALGFVSNYRAKDTGHIQWIMHHELAKALDQLGWFAD